jgi:hypothetical protein
MVRMNKIALEKKIIKDDKEQHLSAQEYMKLTPDEKGIVREIIQGKKIDPDEYEANMKKLWPKPFTPKPLVWRKK